MNNVGETVALLLTRWSAVASLRLASPGAVIDGVTLFVTSESDDLSSRST